MNIRCFTKGDDAEAVLQTAFDHDPFVVLDLASRPLDSTTATPSDFAIFAMITAIHEDWLHERRN